MPAKKVAGKSDTTTGRRVDVPQNGLFTEQGPQQFPLWDPSELEREFGDASTLATTHDPNTAFVDLEGANLGASLFDPYGPSIDWKRPAAVFSPFKPVVFRDVPAQNPYEYEPPHEDAPMGDDESYGAAPIAFSCREEAISCYREVRPLRALGDEDEAGAKAAAAKSRAAAAAAAALGPTGGGSGAPSPSRKARAGAGGAALPFFMAGFHSALMVVFQNHFTIAQGNYLWELIYPQAPSGPARIPLPRYNPAGKYCVRLFIGGAFRKITIDDRLPTDSAGRCLLSVTDHKEIWPALLAKAIMKALTPAFEAQLVFNPVAALSILMAGWTPQLLNPRTDDVLVYRMMRAARSGLGEPLVICATCTDSTSPVAAANAAAGPFQAASITSLLAEGGVAAKVPHQGANTSGGKGDALPPLTAIDAAAAHNVEALPHPRLAPDAGDRSSAHLAALGGTFFPLPAEAVTPAPYPTDIPLHSGTFKDKGLKGWMLFSITNMRCVNDRIFLHMYAPGVEYCGPMAAGSEAWTEDVRAAIETEVEGYEQMPVARRRNDFWLPWEKQTQNIFYLPEDRTADTERKWRDFWIPWDVFVHHFQSLVVMRNAADRNEYPNHRVFAIEPMLPAGADANATTAGAVKRPGKLSAPTPVQQVASPSEEMGQRMQRLTTRWIHVNNTTEIAMPVVVVLAGVPQYIERAGADGSSHVAGAPSAAPAAPSHRMTKAQQAAAAAAAANAPQPVVTTRLDEGQLAAADAALWTVVVERFEADGLGALTRVAKVACPRGLSQSVPLSVPPQCESVYRLVIANAPVGCTVSVLAPDRVEVASGTEREVLADMAHTAFGSDAGHFGPTEEPQYGASYRVADVAEVGTAPRPYTDPRALQAATLWFKRHIQVRAETRATFTLTTLPKNTDLSVHRVGLHDAAGRGKAVAATGGKAPAAAATAASMKGRSSAAGYYPGAEEDAAAAAAAAAADAMDEPPHDRPIIDFTDLVLVELDTGRRVVGTVGRILNATLSPSRLGYMLLAYSRTPENYGPGLWKLSYTANRPLDVFESRGFDELQQKHGKYMQNDNRQVFRYNFSVAPTPGEAPTASSLTAQVCLRDEAGPVPFMVELLHSTHDPAAAAHSTGAAASKDKSPERTKGATAAAAASTTAVSGAASPSAGVVTRVAEARGTHLIMLDHATVLPNDKGSPNYYTLVCTLEDSYAASWERHRLEQVQAAFRAAKSRQDGQMLQLVFDRRCAIKAGQAPPEAPQDATDTVVDATTPIVYSVNLHLSAAKVELHEDTTVADALCAIKHGWRRRAAEDAVAAKAAAAAAAVAATSQAKGGKPAGAATAAVASKAAKQNAAAAAGAEQQLQEEMAAHAERAREARRKFLANRTGQFLPYVADDGTPVLTPEDDPALAHLPPSSFRPGSHAAYLADPARLAAEAKFAALRESLKDALPGSYARGLLGATCADAVTLRDLQRKFYENGNAALRAHWAEVAPSKPLDRPATVPAEEEPASRKRAASKKPVRA